jgi:hypothetical protein
MPCFIPWNSRITTFGLLLPACTMLKASIENIKAVRSDRARVDLFRIFNQQRAFKAYLHSLKWVVSVFWKNQQQPWA